MSYGIEASEKAIAAKQRARNLECRRKHRSYWVVLQRQCNYSSFNGGHCTPSDYSAVRCDHPDCGRVWRTKAAYIDELPDNPCAATQAYGATGCT